jgi:dienelactone hydrolase
VESHSRNREVVPEEISMLKQPPTDVPTRAREAEALLQHADFFGNDLPVPAVRFHSATDFEFTSPVSTPWPENNTVPGKFYRAATHWQDKRSVILLHGWNSEPALLHLFPWIAKRLVRAGVNALFFELPYHGRRKPEAHRAFRNFISPDLAHMVQAAQQGLAEIRALLAWLADQGSPQAGLWGISLGAWLAGLASCHEPRTGPVVLMSPVLDLEQAVAQLPFCRVIRESLNGASVKLTPLNISQSHPVIPPKQILIIECLHDQFVSPESIEAVWQNWNKPNIWRIPHGHISVLLSRPVMKKTIQWLAEQHR